MVSHTHQLQTGQGLELVKRIDPRTYGMAIPVVILMTRMSHETLRTTNLSGLDRIDLICYDFIMQ